MRRAPLAIAIALLLVPGAAATWRGYGGAEPDNRYDATGAYLWTTPPTATDQVYFDVVAMTDGDVSPNSATLGDRLPATPETQYQGFLGVWVDCNHDGYIGMADGAMVEYRAEASLAASHPIDTTICPMLPDTSANQGRVHYGVNGWVTEMIPLGSAPISPIGPNARYLYDPGALVWGDRTPPGPLTSAPPGSCTSSTYALASGEAQHTGGPLQHLDCRDGSAPQRVYDDATLVAPPLTALPPPASLYAKGGPLDKPTFGPDNRSRALVSGEQSCSSSPIVPFAGANATLAGVWPPGVAYPLWFPPGSGIRAPAPRVDTSGGVAGSYDEAFHETPGPSYAGLGGGNCRPDDRGASFYGNVESGYEVSATRKASADIGFSFSSGSRVACGGATKSACGWPEGAGVIHPEGYWRPDASILAGDQDLLGATGPTKASLVYTDVSPAKLQTFYAHVELAGVETPGQGAYGAEACSGIGPNAPDENGWACDPAAWSGVPVGEAFELRDVECQDNALVGADASPTHQEIGPRDAPLVTDPAHGCW